MAPLPLLAALLACAQNLPSTSSPTGREAVAPARATRAVGKPITTAGKIVNVTIYQNQALVTREVDVPAGEGTVELIIAPLPDRVLERSAFAEGNDAARVVSTRGRGRVVDVDLRKEVRDKQAQLARMEDELASISKEIEVQEADLKYLTKLEGFTGTTLSTLTDKGKLDSEAILSISEYVMKTRSSRTKAEVELHQRQKAAKDSVDFLKKQLAELALGSNRVERDALIVVRKLKPEATKVRFSYLVGSANWVPQYRLRGTSTGGAVRLEYQAEVSQQTGEDWVGVSIALSTSRPSLDAAPPELLPLRIAEGGKTQLEKPQEFHDLESQKIVAFLDKKIDMPFPNETPFEAILKYLKSTSVSPALPNGISIYVDPIALQEVEKTINSPVSLDVTNVQARAGLQLVLEQMNLDYRVEAGILRIFKRSDDDDAPGDGLAGFGGMGGMGGISGEFSGSLLNQSAATEQAAELRVNDDRPTPVQNLTDADIPSALFQVPGLIDVLSRPEPQQIDVARGELPAQQYAKAVPVLTTKVYRLAKLTNATDQILLPGEATVYLGTDFVGRMRLPLVAVGESFIAGFGVDPQIQVSRRLLKKERTVQGGNQVFSYEFRMALRNYHPHPVKVELWDRLPKPESEAVGVKFLTSSQALSTDAMYLRTARLDNILRWDLEVPKGTVGEKTLDLNYEFQLEYAKDLPQPRFLSGSLKEMPLGGGAMGGMGGMGGGFR